MATEKMYIDMAALNQLKDELDNAIKNFETSIKDLKSGIDALGGENSAFSGTQAMVFKSTFAGAPSGTLEELLKSTRELRDYMDQKIIEFSRTLGNINAISTRI